MYRYPSGLKCRASVKTIRIFEYLFVPVFFLFVLIGAPWLAIYLSAGIQDFGIHMLAIGGIWLSLSSAAVSIAVFVFEIFCKPIR